ncbi:hypothetical protein CIB84_010128 [Bambusicola thoracicus]|uniref:Uncharacterized protein n=1 Tax=Bambusicola thoracicus TaxID=9083 RepID=A0A2P4SPT0_BAMTH|nr:hypothetical protein CIB84_010128 [Bambusicola thoracicus]
MRERARGGGGGPPPSPGQQASIASQPWGPCSAQGAGLGPPQRSAGLRHPRLRSGHGRSGRNPAHLEEKEGGRMEKLISTAQVMRAGEARLHANPESAVCLSL